MELKIVSTWEVDPARYWTSGELKPQRWAVARVRKVWPVKERWRVGRKRGPYRKQGA